MTLSNRLQFSGWDCLICILWSLKGATFYLIKLIKFFCNERAAHINSIRHHFSFLAIRWRYSWYMIWILVNEAVIPTTYYTYTVFCLVQPSLIRRNPKKVGMELLWFYSIRPIEWLLETFICSVEHANYSYQCHSFVPLKSVEAISTPWIEASLPLNSIKE